MVWLNDLTKATSAASGMLFAGWVSLGIKPVTPVFAQIVGSPSSVPSVGSESILEFAVRQGGAFAILALVLFYYRRDYRDLTADRTTDKAILVNLISEQTKVMSEMTSAMRETNVVVRETKEFMAQHQIVERRKL